MPENNHIPALRFKGFTDPWKKCKLGDIVDIVGGNAWKSDDYVDDGEYLVVTIANVQGDYYIDDTVGSRINPKEFQRYLLYPEDILISLTGNVGRVSRMTSSRAVLNQRVGKIVPYSDSDNEFIFQTLRNPDFLNSMLVAGQGAAQINISSTDVLMYEIAYPNIKEQRKVGTLFQGLDSLITLHQCKYDKLVDLKKSLLKKMFPKSGCDTPELRFAGFTDPWEQRKLGEVAGVYDGVHQTPDYKTEGVMFLSVENITTLHSQKYISEDAFTRDYAARPERGDILMTRIGDIGTSNVIETDDKLAFYVSLALLKPAGIDSYYLNKCLQSPSAKNELFRRTLHIAFPKKINKNEIAEVILPIPSNPNEQYQIGIFFQRLDSLITLHQRELDLLKNVKKSLLEKMFV